MIHVPGNLKLLIRLTAFTVALAGTGSRIVLSLTGDMGTTVLLFFTVQSNLMVCLYLGIELAGRLRRRGSGESRILPPGLQGAVMLYIAITGLVFNVLIAPGWHPEGVDLLISRINHTVTPLLFLADWFVSQKRGSYGRRHLGFWLLYPIVYGITATIEGNRTGEYRYFFLDYSSLGTGRYLVLMGIVTAAFLLTGMILLRINNLNPYRRRSGESDVSRDRVSD